MSARRSSGSGASVRSGWVVTASAVTTPQPPALIDDDTSLLKATKAAAHNSYAGGFGANPGLSLPSGFDRKGLPMGLQLEAAWWEEPTLLRVGTAYQAATDWHLAIPQLT